MKWSPNLDALQGSNQSKSMSISSEGETIEFDNIMIGDVWILGGQYGRRFGKHLPW